MEITTVGSVPFFTWKIEKWLPTNKKKREKIYEIKMIILTYIVYALFNMARRPLAVVKSKLLEDCHPSIFFGKWDIIDVNNSCNESSIFNTTAAEYMGFLESIFLGVYGITLYPSGVIGDLYNPRYFLSMGCLLSGFFCALLALADFWHVKNFNFFVVTLMLFGACQSTGWPIVLSSVTHWYSGGKRGLFFGFWNTHNYVGSILGIIIAGVFADDAWGYSFCIPGFILAVVAFLVYNCFVADPKDLKELEKEPATALPPTLKAREVPPWLQANRSIEFYDAMRLPGVFEFSTCMFFSRMVGYIFLFWIPTIMTKVRHINAAKASTYAIAYCCGGSLGGILAGVFVDIYKRSVLTCALFIAVTIPVLFMLLLIENTNVPIGVHFFIFIVIGILVEAPYIVTSTSVSADLSTHKMIKRNHRALATIGGIMEGTGAVGAAIGTFLCGFIMIRTEWVYSIFVLVVMQILALLCVSRQAYKDFYKEHTTRTLDGYWRRSPSF